MTPIQQAYNEINELTAKNINEFRAKVRVILERLGAKETTTKPTAKCKA
jgi:hypothetical protein